MKFSSIRWACLWTEGMDHAGEGICISSEKYLLLINWKEMYHKNLDENPYIKNKKDRAQRPYWPCGKISPQPPCHALLLWQPVDARHKNHNRYQKNELDGNYSTECKNRADLCIQFYKTWFVTSLAQPVFRFRMTTWEIKILRQYSISSLTFSKAQHSGQRLS